VLVLAATLVWVAPRVAGQGGAVPSTANGEWYYYTADVRESR
jgi:hypothetical protein